MWFQSPSEGVGHPRSKRLEMKGLYANVHAKRERIKEGSGERMRKPGAKGAPSAKAFKQAAKTVKKPRFE